MSKEKVNTWYDEDYFDSYPRHDRRIQQILDRLQLKSTDSVCEFGCGLGHILIAIAPRISSGLGIDVSEYAVSRAEDDAKSAGFENITFKSIDIEKLVYDQDLAKSFDVVLMMDISEHLYDETLLRFFASARAVLKPEGRLIIHTPNAGYYLERMKARNFILKQFESHIAVRNFEQHLPFLEANHFSDIETQYLPHYNRVLKIIDTILMHVPLLGKLFRARLLIAANAR